MSSEKSGSYSTGGRDRTLYEKDAEKILANLNVSWSLNFNKNSGFKNWRRVEVAFFVVQLKIGSAVMAAKPGAGREGDTEVETNVYTINMKQMTVFRYSVSINGFKTGADGKARVIDYTKKSISEWVFGIFRNFMAHPLLPLPFCEYVPNFSLYFSAVSIMRRDLCRSAIEMFCRERRDMAYGAAGCIYNDLQSILYTLNPLANIVCFFAIHNQSLKVKNTKYSGGSNFSKCPNFMKILKCFSHL